MSHVIICCVILGIKSKQNTWCMTMLLCSWLLTFMTWVTLWQERIEWRFSHTNQTDGKLKKTLPLECQHTYMLFEQLDVTSYWFNVQRNQSMEKNDMCKLSRVCLALFTVFIFILWQWMVWVHYTKVKGK